MVDKAGAGFVMSSGLRRDEVDANAVGTSIAAAMIVDCVDVESSVKC